MSFPAIHLHLVQRFWSQPRSPEGILFFSTNRNGMISNDLGIFIKVETSNQMGISAIMEDTGQ